jgi:redox-sensitive bicupin YhaK (pirin superfamily)
MGVRSLRVINEDRVAPGGGFAEHSHQDMEILTYVLEGSLQHRDSTGAGATLVVGDIQRMSAGTGITHSEFNASQTEPAHFLQIWIHPAQKGLTPSYEKTFFPEEDMWERLCVLASPDGREKSLTIHQDVVIYDTALMPGQSVVHALAQDRAAWVQVVRGEITLNGIRLSAGDGAAVTSEPQLVIEALARSETLLFDLA